MRASIRQLARSCAGSEAQLLRDFAFGADAFPDDQNDLARSVR
jgi:hypothetical protein